AGDLAVGAGISKEDTPGIPAALDGRERTFGGSWNEEAFAGGSVLFFHAAVYGCAYAGRRKRCKKMRRETVHLRCSYDYDTAWIEGIGISGCISLWSRAGINSAGEREASGR